MRIFSGKVEVKNVSDTLSKINDAADACGSVIVVIDAEKTAGVSHIESAVLHAQRSFAAGENIARTLAMEVLVYVSGQRQCSLAAKFGLHEGKNAVYAVILEGDEARAEAMLKEIISVCDVPPADTRCLMREFDISEEELSVTGEERIGELVAERTTMVDAWK